MRSTISARQTTDAFVEYLLAFALPPSMTADILDELAMEVVAETKLEAKK